jgi:hypothetical protein
MSLSSDEREDEEAEDRLVFGEDCGPASVPVVDDSPPPPVVPIRGMVTVALCDAHFLESLSGRGPMVKPSLEQAYKERRVSEFSDEEVVLFGSHTFTQ